MKRLIYIFSALVFVLVLLASCADASEASLTEKTAGYTDSKQKSNGEVTETTEDTLDLASVRFDIKESAEVQGSGELLAVEYSYNLASVILDFNGDSGLNKDTVSVVAKVYLDSYINMGCVCSVYEYEFEDNTILFKSDGDVQIVLGKIQLGGTDYKKSLAELVVWYNWSKYTYSTLRLELTDSSGAVINSIVVDLDLVNWKDVERVRYEIN